MTDKKAIGNGRVMSECLILEEERLINQMLTEWDIMACADCGEDASMTDGYVSDDGVFTCATCLMLGDIEND